MRIVWASNHYQDVKGYAKIVYEILSRLVKEPTFEVYHFGWRQHPTFRREKIVGLKGDYVASKYDGDMGETQIERYLSIVKPDLFILYNCNMYSALFYKHLPKNPKYKRWIYLDQVYKCGSISTIPCDKFLVFSKEWIMPIDTPQYVLTHAPSSNAKTLSDEEKERIRWKLGLAPDEPVFLSINTNTMRKRLDLLIQSFKLYKDKGGAGTLLLITSSGSNAYYNLNLIMNIEQAPYDKVKVVENGYLTDEQINQFMNIADYGVNTSDGEGWGIASCDMAFLGKPQLSLDIGAYRTFLNDETAVLIKPTIREYRSIADYCGLYKETTTPENFAEGFDLIKLKSKPSVSLNWDDVVNGLIEEIKRV